MTPRIWDTPWKIRNEIWRCVCYPRVRLLFALNGIRWGQGWRIHGVPIVQKHRRSSIKFGPRLGLRSSVRANPLGTNHPVIIATWHERACLEVGEDFAMTGGTLCAAQRILIGNRVSIGANTTIVDTDFHPIDPVLRRSAPGDARTAPVVIEDDVFVGMNCLILKGVTIGRGSVVGAGSVVTADVPPYAVVGGGPLRLISRLSSSSQSSR